MTVVPTFHTAVLSASPEQTGVELEGEEGTELVLVSISLILSIQMNLMPTLHRLQVNPSIKLYSSMVPSS